MNNFINKLFVSLTYKLVGNDEFGNKYYESRRINRPFSRRARQVIYRGNVEASKVPGHWSNWLHFQVDQVPINNEKQFKWEKNHIPNMTGTVHAYLPPGHILSLAKRERSTGDYQRWIPKE